MQSIRSKDSLPEKVIFHGLRSAKIYFSSHQKNIFGTPDVVFRRKRIAIFIDSDFWHGNPKKLVLPKTNKAYWGKKIFGNRQRDARVNRYLKKEGWVVLRFWESKIKKVQPVALIRY